MRQGFFPYGKIQNGDCRIPQCTKDEKEFTMDFRRIFEERNYDITGHVLPLEDLKLCSDMPGGFSLRPENRDIFIKKAEDLLGKEITPLTATDYMIYCRTGNRKIFQQKYFSRRIELMIFTYAEYGEGKGRFTDAIVDRLWAILEESTWVIPAHNGARPGQQALLTYAFTEKVDYIDLSAAATAAELAVVGYLLKDTLDAVTPLLYERLLYELDRRAIRPYIDEENLRTRLWWSGLKNGRINNWCPWIISNLLTVCALTVRDMNIRETVTRQSMWLLNNFTAGYHDDGGCDEGPSYWGVSGASLFDCCCLLYDMTGGYVNMFDDPLLRRMGEYRPAVYVANGHSLNFADASPQSPIAASLALDWGHRIGSDTLVAYGRHFAGGTGDPGDGISQPYRLMRRCSLCPEPEEAFILPQKVYLNGLQVAVTRECDRQDAGLYLALKGGHNGESHNHCDTGSFVVYSDGRPLFIDPGVCTYTARTFGPTRYTIWAMCSDYHNTATVNNCVQSVGSSACTKSAVYDENTGKLTLDLTDVYPEEAGLSSYTRSAVLQDGTVTVTDTLAFDGEGCAAFHLMTILSPEDIRKGSFRLGGCTVTFDESLTVEMDLCDHSIPETVNMAQPWGVDAIRRITLRSKPFASHTFTLKISK